MNLKERIIIIASMVTCFLIQAQGADKYTDGNRPYEFGFSIDGEQHRHEKKDEKGLIEGEFGFITADGVYHVTVYATDEQGRFKILSMKNIRVKPYPTYTAKQSSTSARQGHSLELPASSQTAALPAVTTTTFKPISIQPPVSSCSSCSIPTTSTPPPFVPALNQPFSNSPNQVGLAVNPKFPLGVTPQSAIFGQPNGANSVFPQQGPRGSTPQQNYPTQPQNSFVPQSPLEQGLVPPRDTQNVPQQSFGTGQNSFIGSNDPQKSQVPGSSNPLQSSGIPKFPQQQPQIPEYSPPGPEVTYPRGENEPSVLNSLNGQPFGPQKPSGSQYPGENSDPARENVASGRTPKRLDGESSFGPVGTQPNSLQRGSPNGQSAPSLPTKPTLISAQMQIVDKNTDIYHRGPGENDGLPEGLNKDDMSRLLYTFNYTVGFHGHFEEGYTNGAKQGYYFITGRNGVRTRVDYVADSKGFRPKISQEVLDLLSEDVPKPETEKEEKYGLKGYEFKWLYYPVEAKGR